MIQPIQIVVAVLMRPTLIKQSVYPAEVLKSSTKFVEVTG